jgi:hypothetical protein
VEPELPTTQVAKHVRFRSPSLSAFWGIDVFIEAWVLLPNRFIDDETNDMH